MAVQFTTLASDDIVKLQQIINDTESDASVRLTSLKGETFRGKIFNAHVYKSVDGDTLPFSKLFIIPDGGSAANDPTVQTWLALNPTQQIICEGMVYISGLVTKIAVIR